MMFPDRSSVNVVDSEEFTIPLLLISKVPLTIKVPEAPAYLPVPPVIFALPLMVMVAGAESESAQP